MEKLICAHDAKPGMLLKVASNAWEKISVVHAKRSGWVFLWTGSQVHSFADGAVMIEVKEPDDGKEVST